MDQNSKYWETFNFIISYFGDYREGKTEKDLILEASKENSPEYLEDVKKNLRMLIADENIDFVDFLDKCNVYEETKEKALDWLKLVLNELETISK